MAVRKPLVIGPNVVQEWQAGDAVAVGHLCGANPPPTITTSGLGVGAGATLTAGSTDLAGEIVVTTALVSVGVGATVNLTFGTAFAGRPFVVLAASTANAVQLAAATNQAATGFSLTVAVSLAASSTYKWTYHAIGQPTG